MDHSPRFDVPVRYIRAHYEPDDRLCVALIKRIEGRSRIQQEFAEARAICDPKYQAHLRAANANGADVYLSVNTIKADRSNRTKADIDQVRHLFVDIDERGAEVVKAILASDLPKPSAVIESSRNRFQVLWSVNGFGKDQAEAAVSSIAMRFEADQSVWDCARVLRIPGFRNTKREEPFYARIVPGERSAQILTPADFPAFPQLERTIYAPQRAKVVAGHSQSEKDWAYALRALERGVSPAEIAAKIEAYRTGNKQQAHRYAERTVEKAIQVYERKSDRLSNPGMKEDVMNEQQNVKSAAQLTTTQIEAETRELHAQYEQLKERYEQAPQDERREIREKMSPLVNRERELREEYSGRVKPEITHDRGREQEMGYSR